MAGAAIPGIYGSWVRPRIKRWGATDEEATGPFPGAERLPGGKRSLTTAVTIDAPPEEVWPWLVQLGWDRGGWYTWDLLDNAGRRSATEVHPEWQDLAVGDMLKFWVLGHVADAFRVAVIEPNKYLELYGYSDLMGRWLDPDQPRPTAYMEATWGFQLTEPPGGRTRLLVSGYQTYRPTWIETIAADWVVLPVAWIMQARMMSVLKRNIERASKKRVRTAAVSLDGDREPEGLPATA